MWSSTCWVMPKYLNTLRSPCLIRSTVCASCPLQRWKHTTLMAFGVHELGMLQPQIQACRAPCSHSGASGICHQECSSRIVQGVLRYRACAVWMAELSPDTTMLRLVPAHSSIDSIVIPIFVTTASESMVSTPAYPLRSRMVMSGTLAHKNEPLRC